MKLEVRLRRGAGLGKLGRMVSCGKTECMVVLVGEAVESAVMPYDIEAMYEEMCQ